MYDFVNRNLHLGFFVIEKIVWKLYINTHIINYLSHTYLFLKINCKKKFVKKITNKFK